MALSNVLQLYTNTDKFQRYHLEIKYMSCNFPFALCLAVECPSEDLALEAHKPGSAAGQQWPPGTKHILDPSHGSSLCKPTCYQALQVIHIYNIHLC